MLTRLALVTALIAVLVRPVAASDAAGAAATREAAAVPDGAAGAEAAAEAVDRDARHVAPAIVANRPGFAESTEVTGAGVVQVEVGLALDRDGTRAARVHTLALPLGLLRLGVTPRLELQVGGEGIFSRVESTPSSRTRHSGGSDLDVGAKAKLLDEARSHVTMAVAGSINVPAGSAAFSSHGYDPVAKVALSRTLGAGFSVYGTAQTASVSDDEGRLAQHGVSAAVSRTLPAGWGVYGELFQVTPSARGARPARSLDAGLVRTLGANAQVDAWVARGLTRAAADWSCGVGFAVRRVR